MLRNCWTFGLSAEQEDRFRRAYLASDLVQARICILLVISAITAFAVNDYAFFGLSWRFGALQGARLGVVACTLVLLARLRGLSDYRAYDRAEFAWGLVVSLFAIATAASRPSAFVAHVIAVVMSVFVTVLAVPNRFSNQLALCLVYTVGEGLVLAAGLATSPQASITGLLSLLLANSIAVACGWQLHTWRRREFLAREEQEAAAAEAERQLAERHRAEEALQESERRVRLKLESILSPDGDVANLELADLVDTEALQAQMESFYAVSGIPVGIIDLQGTVLVGVGWQDVCTTYHRAHAETRRHCIESDTHLSAGIPEGEHRLYKCKNNMWDVATPIVVGGRHVGNIFTGQFLFDDEEPDLDLFRDQARRYGFPEQEYLAALSRVPRFTRRQVHEGMAFYARLAHMLSRQGYSNLTLARTLAERDRLTSSLRNSEARYRTLVDLAPDAVFVHQEGRIVFANPAAVSLVGASGPDQIIGRDILELVHPDDRPTSGAHVRDVEVGVQTPVTELRVARIDGPTTHCEATAIGIEYPGTPAVQVTVRDITERKEAERLQQSTLGRFHAVLSSMYSAVLLVGSDGRVDYANPAFCERFGLSDAPADLVGLTSREMLEKIKGAYLHPDEALARIREIVESGQPVRGEAFAMRDGGTCLRDFVPLLVHGESYGRLWLHFDITETKRTEEALRHANLQLAEADRRKNEFLAVLSHELRNPLAPIKNGLYVLDHAAPGGDQARRAQAVIARQVDQLARLVDDLLDVTRITRNKVRLQRQPLELNELVRRTIEDHRTFFEQAAVHVAFEPATSALLVDADWNRLAQVVGNLLQNAAKFTPRDGHVRVALSIDGAATRARIRVADTGVGMTPEMLARLFVPFTQADATLDRSRGGLGLGLALVKGLVELHGGDVSASSAGLGRGSEFTIRLPLDVVRPAGSPDTAAAPARVRRRVLVIEDNVDAAEMLREVLEFAGHEVAVAGDGPDGIARARAWRPDVVLCDIGLPGMTGYEVARAFRADDGLRRTHLVALSGYALPEDLQQAAASGFERHLAKPPSLETLEALLAAIPAASHTDDTAEATSG